MFALKKAFELAVCLLGYWIGKGFGGWGGGVILAFAGLYATSYGWERLLRNAPASLKSPPPSRDFAFGAVATAAIMAASFVLWGK